MHTSIISDRRPLVSDGSTALLPVGRIMLVENNTSSKEDSAW